MKKLLITGLLFIATSAQAATSISTTLTMTSPSAIISMTGVSSTAYFKNVSETNVSQTALTLGSRLIDPKAIPCASFTYDGNAQSTLASTSLITSINRRATGIYDVSGTFPGKPWVSCTPFNTAANAICSVQGNIAATAASPTVAGFLTGTQACSTGTAQNATTTCQVYCQ